MTARTDLEILNELIKKCEDDLPIENFKLLSPSGREDARSNYKKYVAEFLSFINQNQALKNENWDDLVDSQKNESYRVRARYLLEYLDKAKKILLRYDSTHDSNSNPAGESVNHLEISCQEPVKIQPALIMD